MTLFETQDASPPSQDVELLAVEAELLGIKDGRDRFGRVLRDTIDQLLDGERTGRFDPEKLFKTEKTHAGTLVEINLQREFEFANGQDMDYRIAGVDVDCKFSKDLGGWMIPPEALDEICLLVWADDRKSLWSAGLFRAETSKLTQSGTRTRKGNRDKKLRLNKENLHLVRWLWHNVELTENILLHLPTNIRDRILASSSGQARINELFRLVQGRRIGRGTVRTVARQLDYMARIREDGGTSRARPRLRQEGIIILGEGLEHAVIAKELGGPVPQKGEFVSFRIARAQPHHAAKPSTYLWGDHWVVADPDDPVEELLLPLPKREGGRKRT
ncbi:NaeI family type II restriction endonuclease [Nonomuraea sp. NPDC049655]|uniref:NaeI family type II restriction endonuclease n=1 Tax=Nonomuraea sp. NPDC049655 TaxID=3364355 RepID=UPI00378BD30F